MSKQKWPPWPICRKGVKLYWGARYVALWTSCFKIACQVSSVHIYPLLCHGHSWRVRLTKQEKLTPPGHLVSPRVYRGPWCFIVGTTVTVHQFVCILHFCRTCSLCDLELVVQFPARGSTQVFVCLFPVGCGCDTFYIVSVHIQCQASIYTLCCVAGIHGGCS